jgi:hypothetical protein
MVKQLAKWMFKSSIYSDWGFSCSIFSGDEKQENMQVSVIYKVSKLTKSEYIDVKF